MRWILLTPFLIANTTDVEMRGMFVEAVYSAPSPTIITSTHLQVSGTTAIYQ